MNEALHFLRATIRREYDEADSRADALDRLGGEQSQALIAAAFFLAVDKRFQANDRDAIARYVRELGDSDLKPSTAEAFIRAALGESHLTQGIPAEEAFHTQLALMAVMVGDDNPSDEELDEFLSKTQKLADEWLAAPE